MRPVCVPDLHFNRPRTLFSRPFLKSGWIHHNNGWMVNSGYNTDTGSISSIHTIHKQSASAGRADWYLLTIFMQVERNHALSLWDMFDVKAGF